MSTSTPRRLLPQRGCTPTPLVDGVAVPMASASSANLTLVRVQRKLSTNSSSITAHAPALS
jgi:hypothetical protein